MRLLSTLMFLTFYAVSTAEAAILDVNVGPAINSGVFWIDPTAPNHNVPFSYQHWGVVFTTPTTASVLDSVSFYVSPSGEFGATEFGVGLYEWSSALKTPIGDYLYKSALTSLPGAQEGDAVWGIYPTTFSTAAPVTEGKEYMLEFHGNGSVGIVMASAMPDVRLYLQQSNIGSAFHPFGDFALRSDMVFSTVSPVPLPAALPMFGFGIISLLGYIRVKKV